MTWTITKAWRAGVERPVLHRQLRQGGNLIATFPERATDDECEIIRKALDTADALVEANNKIVQREARLQEKILELAEAVNTITRLEVEAKLEGKTNA